MSKETTGHESKLARPRFLRLWILVVTLLAAGAVVLILALLRPDLVFPSSGQSSDWTTSTAEEQGMDASKLEAMMAYIDERDMARLGYLMLRASQR